MSSLNVQLEAVIPTRKFPDASVWKAALRRAVDRSQKDVLDDLKAVTATWNHQPKWRTRFTEDSGNLQMTVTTTDVAFIYLDRGTGSFGPKSAPYPIPKPTNTGAKILRFQGGYTAKTTPGRLESQAGGPFGDYLFRRSVLHPGVKARGWLELLRKKHGPKFGAYVMAELRKLPKT